VAGASVSGETNLLRFGLPSQHRLSCRGDFVKACDASIMRRVQDGLRIFVDFFGNRSHGLDEKV